MARNFRCGRGGPVRDPRFFFLIVQADLSLQRGSHRVVGRCGSWALRETRALRCRKGKRERSYEHLRTGIAMRHIRSVITGSIMLVALAVVPVSISQAEM